MAAAELIGYLADFPSEVSTRYAAIFLPMSSPTCREFRKWMPPQSRISMCSSASSAVVLTLNLRVGEISDRKGDGGIRPEHRLQDADGNPADDGGLRRIFRMHRRRV